MSALRSSGVRWIIGGSSVEQGRSPEACRDRSTPQHDSPRTDVVVAGHDVGGVSDQCVAKTKRVEPQPAVISLARSVLLVVDHKHVLIVLASEERRDDLLVRLLLRTL